MLKITQAKPNPSGKDRLSRTLTPAVQLAGEWVDIKNVGITSVPLDDLQLYHYAYKSSGNEWVQLMDFSGALGAGRIMRIHSGDKIDLNLMRSEDREGADYHLFTGRDYVWNNDKSDYPGIWNKKLRVWVDKTEYDPYPPEGKILKRVLNKLQ